MKIGILTYHRSHNYGALLQAIALRRVLMYSGHEVFYIDYFPSYHRRMYAVFDKEVFASLSFQRKIKYIYHFLRNSPFSKIKRYYNFSLFIKNHIVPFCRPIEEQFDCIISGSDQIWRKQPYIEIYNPMYFSKVSGLNAKRYISYAASLVDLPNTTEDKNRFLQLVDNFDKISVRETQVKEFIEHHTSLSVSLSLDPTLLLTMNQWESIFCFKRVISEKYLLLYDLQSDFGAPTFNVDEINNIALQKGLRIVRIRAKAHARDTKWDRNSDNPIEFLSLIKYADMILTSSYHGLIFGLLFHRPTWCSFPKNQQRAVSLLKMLNLSHHFLLPNTRLASLNDVDYSALDDKLNEIRKDSLQYLTTL